MEDGKKNGTMINGLPINGKMINGMETKDGKMIKRGYKPNPRLGNPLLNPLSSNQQFNLLLNLLVQFEYWIHHLPVKKLNRTKFKCIQYQVKITRIPTHSMPSRSILQKASNGTR